MSEPVEEKKFVIKHVFKNFISMERYKYHWLPAEIHYNVPWKICVEFDATSAHFHLKCDKFQGKNEWSIDTTIELFFVSKSEEHSNYKIKRRFSQTEEPNCYLESTELEELKNYLEENSLTVGFRVTIKEMTGVKKEKLMDFDESTKEFSDVVLVVKDHKFYVIKKFLARHSSYFQSMFSGNFNESSQSEIEIKDTDPGNFQIFLELIHGESVIEDSTIDGILHLADFFDSKIAIKRCEDFLLNKSEKSLTEKFSIAVRYNLEKIMEVSVSEIKTSDDIRSITNEISSQVEDSIWKVLLLKSLDIK